MEKSNIRKKPCFEKMKIQAPPTKKRTEYFNWASSLVQCLTAAVSFSIISFLITNQINITLLAGFISATGSFISDVLTYYLNYFRKNKEDKAEHDLYIKYLNRRKEAIKKNNKDIIEYYSECYPNPNNCLLRMKSIPLGDRNKSNRDFLFLTIGTVNESVQLIELPILTPDQEEVYAPIYEDFQKSMEVEHTFGVDFKDKVIICIGEDIFDSYLKGIVLDLCYHHSYLSIQIAMVLSDYRTSIPPTIYNGYDYSLISNTNQKRIDIINSMLSILKRRNEIVLTNNKVEMSKSSSTSYILIADEEVLSNSIISQFIGYSHEKIGFSFLLLTKNSTRFLSSADFIFEYKKSLILLHDSTNDPISCNCNGFRLDISWQELSALINNAKDTIQDFKFPSIIHLSKGINAEIAKRYVRQNWDKHCDDEIIEVPIATNEENHHVFIFSFDQHNCGSNLLVAGCSGSGKTEFLITLLLSLTITYSNERIGYYLVDSHEGALIDLFKDTPQYIMGVSETTCDSSEVEQFCVSIESEINERQMLLRDSFVSTIKEYNRKYSRRIRDIIIVVDGFAGLDWQQPSLMKLLTRVGMIGSYLGLHLVISTLYATGYMDNDLLQSMSSRMCFRCTPDDSRELLHSDIATDIRDSGKCYLSQDNCLYELQLFHSEKELVKVIQSVNER